MPINAKNAVFSLSTSTSTGNLNDLSTTLSELTFPREQEELDVTTFGAGGFREFIAGFQSGNLNLTGFWATKVDDVIGGNLGSTNTFPFEYSPDSTTTGKRLYKGDAVVLSYEVDSSIGDAGAYSAGLRVTGTITSTKH